ncbi:flavodoxin (plasmid) [Rhizobium jaguaris]|uniref:Flavodoxin n=2 Tax=Rhizobium jaguaris TaxID=1312183 RepID=A0A387G1N8_9HYPH|nr:flavodoxin [Rhizobium jaguaris]
MTAGLAAAGDPANAQASGQSKVLVAYLTRSGNTRVIAGQISRALEADLFEIETAKPYPADYRQTVAQAEKERQEDFEPPLKATVANLQAYDTVFLGFPVWGETAPSVIRSFLSKHDLSGKTVRPFITYGGYGVGSSLAVLAAHSPGARIEPPFVMEADQERRTLETVTSWLGGLPTIK